MLRRSNFFIFLLCVFLSACVTESPTLSPKKSDLVIADDYFQMGVGYMELGKMDVAMEKLQYSLKLNPEGGKTHDALAVLYEQLGENGKAEKHFKKALQLQPDQAGTLNNYGRFLCEQGKYAQGLEYLHQSMSIPLNTRKWYSLTNAGICENKQGHRQKAEQYFRQALQLRQSYAPALKEMIKISYDNANYVSAMAFLERYLAVAKHTPETLLLGMQIEKAYGNQDKADEYRYQLLEKFPASKEAGQVR